MQRAPIARLQLTFCKTALHASVLQPLALSFAAVLCHDCRSSSNSWISQTLIRQVSCDLGHLYGSQELDTRSLSVAPGLQHRSQRWSDRCTSIVASHRCAVVAASPRIARKNAQHPPPPRRLRHTFATRHVSRVDARGPAPRVRETRPSKATAAVALIILGGAVYSLAEGASSPRAATPRSPSPRRSAFPTTSSRRAPRAAASRFSTRCRRSWHYPCY